MASTSPMSFGQLSISQTRDAIPLFSPPYNAQTNLKYSDVDLLIIKYRTSVANVLPLIPDVLQVEEEPLVTAVLANWGMSTCGPYSEFIQQVEVIYRDERFDYCLYLILNNEGPLYLGREQLGFPKVWGDIMFRGLGLGDHSLHPGFISGRVERPAGNPLVQVAFRPRDKITTPPPPSNPQRCLNLRVIPSAIQEAPPSVKEFVPITTDLQGGEYWVGDGVVSFPSTGSLDPLHRVQVLKYESATLIHKCTATIRPVKQVFRL